MPVGSGPCPRQGRLSTTVYNWVFGTRCIDRIVLAPLSASPPTPGAARMQGSERIAMDCFILLPTFFSRKLDQVVKRDHPWWSWLLINMVGDFSHWVQTRAVESEIKSNPIFPIFRFYPMLSDFYPIFPIFRLFPTFRLADSTPLVRLPVKPNHQIIKIVESYNQ